MNTSKFQRPYDGIVPTYNQQQIQSRLGIEDKEHYNKNNNTDTIAGSSSNRRSTIP